ncbi:DMT family transporter [Granulosicoccaceae sp. 1_MG-2023]|nr:DMT family transporter [Granulosicoccaceae sp. 1_MG-2023]
MFTRFHKLPDNLKGATMLLLAALCFTVMITLIKLAGERLHVTQILFMRQVGMIAMLTPRIRATWPDTFRTQRLGLQFARIGFAIAAMLGSFSAVIHLPLADATTIGFAKSFFVTIAAVLLLGEQIGRHRWTALVLGFAGVLIMLRPGTEGFSVWGLMALGGAACAGVVMVIIRLLSRTEHPLTILAFQATGVGLVMMLPAIYFWQWPTATEWALLASIGFVSYFSQKATIYAYKWAEASLLAPLDYFRLLYAALLSYLVFGLFPSPNTWIGAALIIGAALYVFYREQHRKQAEDS